MKLNKNRIFSRKEKRLLLILFIVLSILIYTIGGIVAYILIS